MPRYILKDSKQGEWATLCESDEWTAFVSLNDDNKEFLNAKTINKLKQGQGKFNDNTLKLAYKLIVKASPALKKQPHFSSRYLFVSYFFETGKTSKANKGPASNKPLETIKQTSLIETNDSFDAPRSEEVSKDSEVPVSATYLEATEPIPKGRPMPRRGPVLPEGTPRLPSGKPVLPKAAPVPGLRCI